MLFLMSKTGDKRKKLEEEKGIVIRFVIGHRWDEILFWIIPSVDTFHKTLPSHTLRFGGLELDHRLKIFL